MIRIELDWARTFEPDDIDDEETVQPELEDLETFLQDLTNISDWLTSPIAAHEDDQFDYNSFHEEVQEKLEALGGILRERSTQRKNETAHRWISPSANQPEKWITTTGYRNRALYSAGPQ